jgi:hypothetical protein
MPTMTSSPDGDGGAEAPSGGGARAGADPWSARRRRTAAAGGCRVGPPVGSPGGGAPGVQRQPKGRITSSVSSAFGYEAMEITPPHSRAALPDSSTVPTVIGQAASARRRRAAVEESPARLASASCNTAGRQRSVPAPAPRGSARRWAAHRPTACQAGLPPRRWRDRFPPPPDRSAPAGPARQGLAPGRRRTGAIRISTSPTAVAVVMANSPARLQGKAPPLAR